MNYKKVLVFALCQGMYISRISNIEKNNTAGKPSWFRRFISVVTRKSTWNIYQSTGFTDQGFWGLVRHPNYLAEILMVFSWSLVSGWNLFSAPYIHFLAVCLFFVSRTTSLEIQYSNDKQTNFTRYCSIVRFKLIPNLI